MFTPSKVAKLVLGVCVGCLAVGLIGSLSRDQFSTTLRRLTTADVAEDIIEHYETEANETFGEEEFVVDYGNQTNQTIGGLPISALPVMWAGRRDVHGIESCGGHNVGYCNSLMYRAHGACGGSGCVLIVNPPGHRTRTPLHIHAYHYNSYGASIKRHMSSKVCKSGGWHSGGFPCGGRAKYFSGFPAVFSAVGGNPIASVTAWPGACGGAGTIVLVSYGCSIEHSICQHC